MSLHQAMDRKIFYSSSDAEKITGRATAFHLAQLTWLGFDYEQSHNDTAIKEFINWIVPRLMIHLADISLYMEVHQSTS